LFQSPVLNRTALRARIAEESRENSQGARPLRQEIRIEPVDVVYQRIETEGTALRSQVRFMELARERAKESEALLGLQSKPLTLATPRALDKLRRRAGKKRKQRKQREE